MNSSRENVTNALREAGLPDRMCGLNADWSSCAWHLGPDDHEPNMVDGDLYLVDDESELELGTEIDLYSVVRSYPLASAHDLCDDGGIVMIECGVPLLEAIAICKAEREHAAPPYDHLRSAVVAVLVQIEDHSHADQITVLQRALDSVQKGS